jgi:competence protein ComEA
MQLGLAFLLGALALLLLYYGWQRLSVPGRPAALAAGQPAEPSDRLDLNTASVAELMQVPGVGPSFAQRIVEHRERHGPFARVEDLLHVPGVGPVLLERWRPYLHADPAAPRTVSTAWPGTPAPHTDNLAPDDPLSRPKKPPAQPIDLNRATREELMQLPGIGPVLADRIIAYRTQHGPFRKVSDITKIKGIKEKTLEKVRPHAYVEEPKPAGLGPDGT